MDQLQLFVSWGGYKETIRLSISRLTEKGGFAFFRSALVAVHARRGLQDLPDIEIYAALPIGNGLSSATVDILMANEDDLTTLQDGDSLFLRSSQSVPTEKPIPKLGRHSASSHNMPMEHNHPSHEAISPQNSVQKNATEIDRHELASQIFSSSRPADSQSPLPLRTMSRLPASNLEQLAKSAPVSSSIAPASTTPPTTASLGLPAKSPLPSHAPVHAQPPSTLTRTVLAASSTVSHLSNELVAPTVALPPPYVPSDSSIQPSVHATSNLPLSYPTAPRTNKTTHAASTALPPPDPHRSSQTTVPSDSIEPLPSRRYSLSEEQNSLAPPELYVVSTELRAKSSTSMVQPVRPLFHPTSSVPPIAPPLDLVAVSTTSPSASMPDNEGYRPPSQAFALPPGNSPPDLLTLYRLINAHSAWVPSPPSNGTMIYTGNASSLLPHLPSYPILKSPFMSLIGLKSYTIVPLPFRKVRPFLELSVLQNAQIEPHIVKIDDAEDTPSGPSQKWHFADIPFQKSHIPGPMVPIQVVSHETPNAPDFYAVATFPVSTLPVSASNFGLIARGFVVESVTNNDCHAFYAELGQKEAPSQSELDRLANATEGTKITYVYVAAYSAIPVGAEKDLLWTFGRPLSRLRKALFDLFPDTQIHPMAFPSSFSPSSAAPLLSNIPPAIPPAPSVTATAAPLPPHPRGRQRQISPRPSVPPPAPSRGSSPSPLSSHAAGASGNHAVGFAPQPQLPPNARGPSTSALQIYPSSLAPGHEVEHKVPSRRNSIDIVSGIPSNTSISSAAPGFAHPSASSTYTAVNAPISSSSDYPISPSSPPSPPPPSDTYTTPSPATASAQVGLSAPVSPYYPYQFAFDVSGVWKLDRARSTPIGVLLKAMEVPWMARKLVESLDVTTTLRFEQTDIESIPKFSVTEESTLGAATVEYDLSWEQQNVVKDGKTMSHRSLVLMGVDECDQDVNVTVGNYLANGPPAPPAPSDPRRFVKESLYPRWGPGSGCLLCTSVLPDNVGETTDERHLVGPHILRLVTRYRKNGVLKATLVRFFNRAGDDKKTMVSLQAPALPFEKPFLDYLLFTRSIQAPPAAFRTPEKPHPAHHPISTLTEISGTQSAADPLIRNPPNDIPHQMFSPVQLPPTPKTPFTPHHSASSTTSQVPPSGVPVLRLMHTPDTTGGLVVIHGDTFDRGHFLSANGDANANTELLQGSSELSSYSIQCNGYRCPVAAVAKDGKSILVSLPPGHSSAQYNAIQVYSAKGSDVTRVATLPFSYAVPTLTSVSIVPRVPSALTPLNTGPNHQPVVQFSLVLWGQNLGATPEAIRVLVNDVDCGLVQLEVPHAKCSVLPHSILHADSLPDKPAFIKVQVGDQVSNALALNLEYMQEFAF